MAQPLSELVTSKQEIVKTRNKLTSLEVQLRALTIAGDMASTEMPNDMTGWYCKAYRCLGEGKYSAIAKMASKGNHPQRLFGWLLKEEMSKSV